jgi:hypothetical protein
MGDRHGPHDGHHRQTQRPEAEQPEHQIQPEGTTEPHLGGDGQRRQDEGEDDAEDVTESHLTKQILFM